jgi:hypothetical protein
MGKFMATILKTLFGEEAVEETGIVREQVEEDPKYNEIFRRGSDYDEEIQFVHTED